MEGEGGGDDDEEAGCGLGASPADCVRERTLLDGIGTARVDVVVAVVVLVGAVAVDVAAVVAAAAGSSWLWVMLRWLESDDWRPCLRNIQFMIHYSLYSSFILTLKLCSLEFLE